MRPVTSTINIRLRGKKGGEQPLRLLFIAFMIVNAFQLPCSVSHSYGFPCGFQLLVYTGMGTVYQMSELCDTIPIWEVWQCLVVSGIGWTASQLRPFWLRSTCQCLPLSLLYQLFQCCSASLIPSSLP